MQFANVGIAAGTNGFNLGASSGNTAVGVLGGAGEGALAGSALGPVGAVIGGLAGAVGGLFGAASAHKEAAAAL